jgi:hypothetical protein
MKTCRVCSEEKNLSDFYVRGMKDGVPVYRNDCKCCVVAKSKKKYFSDLEKSRKYHTAYYSKKKQNNPDMHKRYYAENKERISEINRQSYIRNVEKRKSKVAEWVVKNRGKSNAIKKAYKETKTNALPKWVAEDLDMMWVIDECYDLAVLRSKVTGIKWHVDHVVPLRGKTVCGLHVPWNLQVITASQNCSKSNKFETV